MTRDFNREVKFEIVEQLGVLAEHPTGWTRELNLVAWNGGAPKFDIRDWAPGHEHMSRGVTLHKKEAKHVAELILGYFNEDDEAGSDTGEEESHEQDERTVDKGQDRVFIKTGISENFH